MNAKNQTTDRDDKLQIERCSFRHLDDGRLIEMLFDPKKNPEASFAIAHPTDNGSGILIGREDEVTTPTGLICPLPTRGIIRTKTILLPSCVGDSMELPDLIDQVHQFICRYVAVSEVFHWIAVYYVMFTYVYDRFSVVPYLRVLGGPGSGKTTFLRVVGSLCYKPIFTMGAATMSPIFRLLNTVHGTLILDESDFGRSDEAHLIIKMLNTGYQKGFPLLRSEGKTFEPASFDVFGPKVIASCRRFGDEALESRCITEKMEGKFTRIVPLILPNSFEDEALAIRNNLLRFRLENFSRVGEDPMVEKMLRDLKLRPRLSQIIYPLLCTAQEAVFKNSLIDFARRLESSIATESLDTPRGRVAAAVVDLSTNSEESQISIKSITESANAQIELERHKLSSEKVGRITSDLGFTKTRRPDGMYLEVGDSEAQEILRGLRERYPLGEGLTSL